MKCLLCNQEFTPYKFGDGRQKFCSSLCQGKYWRLKNPKRTREISQKSKKKCKKKRIEYGRKYYAKNKEKLRVKLLAWRRKNKAKAVQQVLLRRYREKGIKGSHTLKEWQVVKVKYDQRCAICRKKVKLTRDHIVPITKGGTNDISNIQPLCGPCNSRKFNHILQETTKR